MRNVTIDNVSDVVIASLGQHGEISERQREIMTSLIKHLHGFCKDVKLQHSEFLQACDYLTRAGQITDDKRQEFILLGDILGVEVLVDMLTNPVDAGESESTVLGPFYRENPPVLPKGASTVQKHFDDEETVYFEGTVTDTNGKPLAGVIMDVWEDAPNGMYENHDPEQPDYNLRGRFETDENGHYAFRAIRPVPYPIPDNETAGELLRYMGHHPNRPGHMHFILSKDGFGTLVSQIYDADSTYLDEDSVFAVKESLVGQFRKAGDNLDTDLHVQFDFVLKEEAAAQSVAAE
ncbi:MULTISPECIES: dioxygenase family protein [Actibacterium]|uniref:Protocatechuate 3,4-dioxygenase beta subunit n=1 Tax=Actibacterium naphthalenivorans TaxID=1614693 RepID=A0A840CI97_9RHOB|nr:MULTISPECIES: dioxygenase [Actibacterium]ALG91508.1 dioxygenase [Actibacterium sp. EMB200-NS6]MBB4022949.1 protocatechuate 3,4-dioxygenase beta subunit [Actibacterium naphthalenivorans]